MDMRSDIERQSQATEALQTYVDEVVAGFETLLLAHKKLSDRALTELKEIGFYLEVALNSFDCAIRHIQEMASQTAVALQVHQHRLTACCAELARADEASAALLCMGVMLNASKDCAERVADYRADSAVSVTALTGKYRQMPEDDGVCLAKRIYDAKVQKAYARSELEACVARKETLMKIYQQSLEAVARTIPWVDETFAMDVLEMTVQPNCIITGHRPDLTDDEALNPFDSDLLGVDIEDEPTPLEHQSSCLTWDTAMGDGVPIRCSDTSPETANGQIHVGTSSEFTKVPFSEDFGMRL